MTQSLITKAKESGLSTKIDNKTIIMDNAKKLVRKIIKMKPDICTTLLQMKQIQ